MHPGVDVWVLSLQSYTPIYDSKSCMSTWVSENTGTRRDHIIDNDAVGHNGLLGRRNDSAERRSPRVSARWHGEDLEWWTPASKHDQPVVQYLSAQMHILKDQITSYQPMRLPAAV